MSLVAYQKDYLHDLSQATQIFDIAASADIEDIMLVDLPNILKYLGLDEVASLPGRKGKAKMKNLYRSVGATYHEGSRAKSLIDSLDMQYLLDNAPVPLYKIEEEIFCNLQKQIELNFFVQLSLHFTNTFLL